MNKIDGILFDLDGTLLNTLDSLAHVYNAALEELGFPVHPVDAYRQFVGDGGRKCAERCLPAGALDENIQALLAIQRERYEENWAQGTRPYEGIDTLLDKLAESQLKLGVLSNKDHHFTLKMVHHFFGETVFDVVQGHQSDIRLKPFPDGAEKSARQMQLETQSMLMVGDSKMDIQTALACNMVAVGVSWGFREREELLDSGCHLLLESPMDLLDHLENSL